MTRKGTRLLAATAISLSLGGFAFAAQHETAEGDCPEDMNTSEGCQMEGAQESESQPVEGAATAPVAEGEGEGTTTMTGPDSDGDSSTDAPSEDAPAESGDATDETDAATEPMDSESGSVEGAETAPVPEGGDAGEGSVTMGGPESDPQSEPEEGDATDSDAPDAAPNATDADAEAGDSAENSDAEPAVDEGDPNIAVASEEGGRYWTEDDVPTFNVSADGEVDWLTFSGFRRYHSECHVCHGPDGEGSSYAPAVKNSAVNMDYYDFVGVVVNGRQNGNSVMPHFGDNLNVMCYLDDIYVYLKARGVDAIPRGRPGSKQAKSDMIQEDEDACMG